MIKNKSDLTLFHSIGILDASELTLITGIDASTCGGELPTISEEENSLFSSDVICTNESNDTEASEEAPLKELCDKNRTTKGNQEKTDCLMRNRGSLLRHKVSLTFLYFYFEVLSSVCILHRRVALHFKVLCQQVTNKVLSSDRANRIGPKVGGCSQPLAASSYPFLCFEQD